MKERFEEVRTANLIIIRAEQDIYQATGLRMQLIPVQHPDYRAYEPKGLLKVIANSLGMVLADYSNKSREENKYPDLRKLGAYFLTQYFPDMSLKKIGELVGGVDHTAVINYKKVVAKLLKDGDVDFVPRYETALNAVTLWMAPEEDLHEDTKA